MVFARVDSNANEIPGILIDGFPMIRFWPAGSDSPLEWKKPEAERTVENVVKFIRENGRGKAS